jgi:hypothetical protein
MTKILLSLFLGKFFWKSSSFLSFVSKSHKYNKKNQRRRLLVLSYCYLDFLGLEADSSKNPQSHDYYDEVADEDFLSEVDSSMIRDGRFNSIHLVEAAWNYFLELE